MSARMSAHFPRRALLLSALALFTTLAAPSVQAAGKLTVTESADFDAPPAEVWKRIGRFGDLGWHPAVASTEITKGTDNQRGAVRSIKTKDGAEIVEELLSRSEGKHQLRYRILTSPLPVAGYESVLKVEPQGNGSRVVWSSRFNRSAQARKDGMSGDQAREVIAGIYRGGFEGLKAQLAQ